MRTVAAIVILLLGASASAAEEVGGDVNALLATYDGNDRARHLYASIHADLIARGIWTAQAVYVARLKQQALYCQPRGLTLTGEQIIELLRGSVQNDPDIGKLDTGLGILRAMEYTFPCSK